MREFINIMESTGTAIDAVLFHGSSNTFDKFESGHTNGWSTSRPGFYFTDDEEVVAEFFGKPVPWRVRLRNAANFEHGHGSAIVLQAVETSPALQKDLEAVRARYGTEMEDRFIASRFSGMGFLQSKEFVSALMKMGFDGMIFDDQMSQTPFTSVVAFHPESAERA